MGRFDRSQVRIRLSSSAIGPTDPFLPIDPRTQQFIRDITDGYFPSELQTRFPNGVPFKVTDKRDIYFTDERKLKAFQGEGHVLHDGRSVQNQQETQPHSSIPQGVRTESSDQRKSPIDHSPYRRRRRLLLRTESVSRSISQPSTSSGDQERSTDRHSPRYRTAVGRKWIGDSSPVERRLEFFRSFIFLVSKGKQESTARCERYSITELCVIPSPPRLSFKCDQRV